MRNFRIFGFSRRTTHVILPLAAIMLWGFANDIVLNGMGMIGAMYDSQAHLMLGRLPVDSLTPGIYQADLTWHTILHVLLVPLMLVPGVWGSQYAGSLLLVPICTLSAAILYRLVRNLSGSKIGGFIAAAAFVINPYVVFFATNTMSEMLLFSFIVLCAYSLHRWFETANVNYLGIMGFFCSVAVMTRPEGFAMSAVAIAIIVAHGILHKTRPAIVWANGFVLSVTCALGVAMRFMPLILQRLFSVFAQATTENVPQSNTPFVEFSHLQDLLPLWKKLHIVWGAYAVQLGEPFLVLMCVLGLLLLLPQKKHFEKLALVALTAAPSAMVATLFLRGDIVIIVKDIFPPPASIGFAYMDLRYLLSGFIALLLMLGLGVGRLASWKRIGTFAALLVSLTVLVLSGLQYAGVTRSKYDVIRNQFQFYGGGVVKEWRIFEDEIYDYGNILTMVQNNHPALNNSNLPLSRFINEYNYRYFEQALNEPWLFARWVVIRGHFPLSQRAAEKDFQYYYELVRESNGTQYYRLNDIRLRGVAKSLGIRPMSIPSLNPYAEWDPATVYSTMRDIRP